MIDEPWQPIGWAICFRPQIAAPLYHYFTPLGRSACKRWAATKVLMDEAVTPGPPAGASLCRMCLANVIGSPSHRLA